MSIGLNDDRVALEVEEEEIARAGGSARALPDERLQLRRRATHGERRRSEAGSDRPAGERGMERIGDDGQIGQFGHGAAIVAGGTRVLDSPGPKGQDS